MYSFVPIDRVQRMKLFESEGWKSFRLNSLAVILGVVITFGGGRLITNCQKRQDAREIVGLFKSDVLRHLDMSEGVIADFTTEMYAMRQCAAASGRGELDKVHEDTLRCALSLFSPCTENQECCFRCQMDDTLGSGFITRGLVPACGLNEAIRAELEDIRTVGY